MRRPLPAFAGALALAALLAGCSNAATTSQPTASSTSARSSAACAATPSGAASDAVKVSADKGTDPKATFSTPLSTDTTQRTVATAGTGAVVPTGSIALVEFALYDGTSGKEVTDTGFDGSNQQQIQLDATKYLPGLVKSIACSTVGSRVVSVMTPADLWGSAGNESLGIAATDSVVMVVDVDDIAKGAGEVFKDMKDMPGVTFDTAGKPTITIPKVDPPTQTRVGIITEGTGAVVPKGATVTVNYTGVVWRNGTTFDSSWDRGTPAQFTTTGVVPGFEAALDYQKVGSTLITVVPPADGYGSEGKDPILPTDTMVFVVTIVSLDS